MDNNNQKCPICNSCALASPNANRYVYFYNCPTCGRFEFGIDDIGKINENHLSSYLFYNAFRKNNKKIEYRYHTTLDKEKCDEYKEKLTRGDISNGLPVHMDSDIVESWYPKTFAERIDKILLFIYEYTDHIGKSLDLSINSIFSLLFIDRKEPNPSSIDFLWRDDNECKKEAKFVLDYLSENSLVSNNYDSYELSTISLTLLPQGYTRVDSIQKNKALGNYAFVAMQFRGDTKALREAIRKGIEDAHYGAIFIDEVEYNDYITPEMLKYIRESKFVVVDLSHKNNGAYFEEGYAMGIGKPVIQLCKKSVKLHFDIAQKNTIIWEKEEDISHRLTNRIKATI